ncbi:Golgi transport complex subunit COG6 [Sporobolomyces koalae]|uniref:Golgi transport complex subunit COG6 n=1 Tax=Sporobolomyces koalae TaxID=500713 RepID=UPI00317D06CB
MTTTVPRPALQSHSSSGPVPASNRNPLHLKVHRLLTSSLDDAATTAALDTLGELEHAEAETESTTDPAAPSKGIRAALVRGTGLRKEIDGRIAQGSKEFLVAFSRVNEKLSMLQSHLDAMHVCCDEVQSELDKANKGTRYLLEHADGLRQQRTSVAVQQSLVHLFLDRFTLSDAELRALSSRDVPVGPELFAAMDKTERIRADCRALLSGEAGEGTKAGLDIMEYTSQHLEAGYQKIFKWCTFQARGFARDVLEVSTTVRAAIARLKSRPDLLTEVLTVLGTTRSTSILNLFLDALTRGGPNGLPRPIELHAHDPLRYIGDMLAWIHQAMAGEREFLESLFGIKDEGRWVGSVHAFSLKSVGNGTQASDQDRVKSLLDKDFEGCGRPLRIRVQQTVKSQESSITAYRISTLIHFYKVTMERTIGSDALMSQVLSELLQHSNEVFFETLRAQGRSFLRFIQPPAAALSAPSQLRDALSTLREIMSVYSSSLLDHEASVASPEKRETDFEDVLDAALDPALQMCSAMAEMRPATWDQAVFWVNCDEAILAGLEPFDFTKKRIERVKEDEAKHVESLTVEHYGHLARDAGLDRLVTAIKSKDDSTPLSTLNEASANVVIQSITTFSNFLSTVDTIGHPRLSLLPPHLASSIHAEALTRISHAYEQVYDAVLDDRNRYEGKHTLVRRSKQEVATLLGVL